MATGTNGIATRTNCNSIQAGSYTDSLSRCVTKESVESAGLITTVTNSKQLCKYSSISADSTTFQGLDCTGIIYSEATAASVLGLFVLKVKATGALKLFCFDTVTSYQLYNTTTLKTYSVSAYELVGIVIKDGRQWGGDSFVCLPLLPNYDWDWAELRTVGQSVISNDYQAPTTSIDGRSNNLRDYRGTVGYGSAQNVAVSSYGYHYILPRIMSSSSTLFVQDKYDLCKETLLWNTSGTYLIGTLQQTNIAPIRVSSPYSSKAYPTSEQYTCPGPQNAIIDEPNVNYEVGYFSSLGYIDVVPNLHDLACFFAREWYYNELMYNIRSIWPFPFPFMRAGAAISNMYTVYSRRDPQYNSSANKPFGILTNTTLNGEWVACSFNESYQPYLFALNNLNLTISGTTGTYMPVVFLPFFKFPYQIFV